MTMIFQDVAASCWRLWPGLFFGLSLVWCWSMRESIVENYLRKRVKQLEGIHRKVVYQGRRGSPDDWCFFPGGQVMIVECKAPGETPRPDQVFEIETLRSFGLSVFVVDSKAAVDDALEAFFDV